MVDARVGQVVDRGLAILEMHCDYILLSRRVVGMFNISNAVRCSTGYEERHNGEIKPAGMDAS